MRSESSDRGHGDLIARSVTPEVKVNQHLCDDRNSPKSIRESSRITSQPDHQRPGCNAKRWRLTLETRNCVLDEDYCSQNPGLAWSAYVQLAVSDNGKGMAPRFRSRIFEPFSPPSRQARHRSGIGHGIRFCQTFRRQHKGLLGTWYSTTFRIYRRVPWQDAITAIPEESLKRPVGGNETVLVVDDGQISWIWPGFHWKRWATGYWLRTLRSRHGNPGSRTGHRPSVLRRGYARWDQRL